MSTGQTAVGGTVAENRFQTTLWASVTVAVPEPWAAQLAEAGAKAPHVTVFGSIPASPAGIEALRDHVAAVAAQARPFELTLRGTSTFRPAAQVAYVAVDAGADRCADLAAALDAGPLRTERRFEYHPHVTIGHGEPDHVLDERQAQLADFEATFPIRALDLSTGYGPADRPETIRWRLRNTFGLR